MNKRITNEINNINKLGYNISEFKIIDKNLSRYEITINNIIFILKQYPFYPPVYYIKSFYGTSIHFHRVLWELKEKYILNTKIILKKHEIPTEIKKEILSYVGDIYKMKDTMENWHPTFSIIKYINILNNIENDFNII